MKDILYYLKKNRDEAETKIAVCDGKAAITFGELYNKVILNACAIREQYGVVDKFFFINNERTIETIIKLLAVAVSGNCYMVHNMAEAGEKYIELTLNDETEASEEAGDIPHSDMDRALYEVCTSGTTGEPKKVVKSQREMLEFIHEYIDTFGFTKNDVFCNHLELNFDASTKDIYGALILGATLHIAPRNIFIFPKSFVEYMNKNKITVLLTAPYFIKSMAQNNGFINEVPSDLKTVLFVGERLKSEYLNYWIDRLPQTKFVNLYGSSEIAGNSIYYAADKEVRQEYVPLKDCFKKFSYEIKEGELCLYGDNIDFFKTGDLAYEENGMLHITGRKDNIRKIRGYRISLEEIERTAESVDKVKEALCEQFEDTLVMVYVSEGGEDLSLELRKALKEKLPKYMIPTKLQKVKKLPLNHNGKYDRSRLQRLI